MNKVKLKPCPWCPSGGSISSGEASSQYPDGRTSIQTGCTECGAMGPERNTEEEADAAWNTRALEAENAALKSSVLSEWVPVSVRLPDKACMVVVAFPGMGMLMQCRAAIYMDGSFSYPSSDQKVRDVRYWTPINPPMNSEA